MMTPAMAVGYSYPTAVPNATSLALDGPTTDWFFLSIIPEGFYYVCVKVDVDDQYQETSEVDNVLRSEKLFYVNAP